MAPITRRATRAHHGSEKEYFMEQLNSNGLINVEDASNACKSKSMDAVDMILSSVDPKPDSNRKGPTQKAGKGSNSKIRAPVFPPLPEVDFVDDVTSVNTKSIPLKKTTRFKKKSRPLVSPVLRKPGSAVLRKELQEQLTSYSKEEVDSGGAYPPTTSGSEGARSNGGKRAADTPRAFSSVSALGGTRYKYPPMKYTTPFGPPRKPKRGEKVFYMLSSETGSPLTNILATHSMPTVLLPQEDGSSVAICSKTELRGLDERSVQSLENLKLQLTALLQQLPESKK